MNSVFLVYLDTTNIKKEGSIEIKYPLLQRRPQLGLLYLSSVLRKNGVEVKILEQSVLNFNKEKLLEKLLQDNPVFAGFYVNYFLKEKVIEYINFLSKNISIPLVVGGPGCFEAEDFLQAGAKAVCLGEGEDNILPLYHCFSLDKGDLSEVPGIIYKDGGQFKKNNILDLRENLDELPFPDWENVNIKNYYDNYLFISNRPYVTMITSRGCPINCAFCSTPQFMGRKVRLRSVDNVLNEISFLKKNYDIKYIAFQDDIFGINVKWLKEFLEKILSKNMKINWSCFLHPFSFREEKEKIFNLMQKAGCNFVHFGIQSANKRILEIINRNPLEPDELKKAISIAKKNNIMVLIDFIFGLPNETEKTIREDIYYSLNSNTDLANFNSLVILPGSTIYKEYQEKKVCALGEEEVKRWIRNANLIFYSRFLVIMKIITYILKYNPFWFKNVFSLLLNVLGNFIRPKKNEK